MKRAAEGDLSQEQQSPPQPSASSFSSFATSSSGGNPFAGISLLGASGSTNTSLFTAAATTASSSDGFATTSAFPSSAPAADSNGKTANPFMGLSLFSTPAAAGGLFTAAATSLQQGTVQEKVSATPAPATDASKGQSQSTPEEELDGAEADGSQEVEEEEEDSGAVDDLTGEEEEEVIFRGDCKLWKLARMSANKSEEVQAIESSVGEEKGWRWQERGCGIVHINRNRKTGAGRMVMRMRGVLKLLLNSPVLPTAKYEKVGQKSVRFVGIDAADVDIGDAKNQVFLSAFRVNLGSSDQQAKFLSVLQDFAKAST